MGNGKMRNNIAVPNMEQLNKFNVNRYGEFEAVREPLYDFQTYVAAGQTSLTFFQNPIGQLGKTIEDTNMELAGALPQPKNFLIESIEVHFFPAATNADLTIGPVTVQQNADALLTRSSFANDVYIATKLGSLNLFIGSKSYVQQGELMRFPPKVRLETQFGMMASGIGTAAGINSAVIGDYASAVGKPFSLVPRIRLIPQQNFNVSLSWNAVQAISADARIGIVLDGVLYRESQ